MSPFVQKCRGFVTSLAWSVLGFAAAFAIACASVRSDPSSPSPAKPTGPAYIVAAVGQYQTWQSWESSPWHRLSDPIGMAPVYVLVADNGHGCVVDGPTWALASQGRAHACATGWRFPRS